MKKTSMRKAFIVAFFVLVLCVFFPVPLSAEGIEEILDKAESETGYVSFFQSIPEESIAFFEAYGIDLSEDMTSLEFSEIVTIIFSLFASVLRENIPLFSVGAALIILFKLLSSVCAGNQRLIESVGYLAAISSGAYSFSVIQNLLQSLTEVTEQSASFLTAALPVICSAQVWSGAQGGAAAAASTLPVVLSVLASAVSSVFYPLCWFCYAASLSGFFQDRISLRAMVSSVKKICTKGVEIISGLAVGVFCVQRAAAASSDTMVRKGVRFALVQMLPLAGSSLTDGMETVYACGKSISGKVGVVCVLSVAALFAVPCVLGLFFVLLYSALSSAGDFLGISLLAGFFADVRDTFAMMTSFSVCSLIVLSSALLLLTGG